MQKIRIIPGFQIICLLLNLLVGMIIPVFAELPPEEEGVCAQVRIRLSQKVAITRIAFKATLEIDNGPDNVPLENLTVTLYIKNMAHESVNNLFEIKEPELTDVNDVEGNGAIIPGTSAKAVWMIIPTCEAAPDEAIQYFVGGTLSYTESGTQINMPLFPATISVWPDPKLVLNYFLVRDVYSDDPFTPEIEPPEPFSLGLIMKNEGKGAARRVKITSSQPEIIENEKGLLIDFEIIGTQVNTDPVSPSLTVDLGEIGQDETSVVQWIMTSSLQGKFQDYEAKFEHTDDLGDTRISLIDSVSIHELEHVVRVDIPDDDEKPDFLVNDIEDEDFLPDTLYNSDGSTETVNVALNTVVNDQVTGDNIEATLTANMPSGWGYIRIDDPGQDQLRLKQVFRSDGREIRIEDNAWTTHRTIRLKGQQPFRQHYLHIFDFSENGGSEQYTLIYEGESAEPERPVLRFIQDHSIAEGIHFSFMVKAGDPNGTIPVLSADQIPPGATFTDEGNGEGTFDWPTTNGQAGKYDVIFTASDGDLTDSQRVVITVCSNQDTDNDGMPDDWEMEHFKTVDRDGTEDFDGDGISDNIEYENNTDPLIAVYDLTVAVAATGGGKITPAEGIYSYVKGELAYIQAIADDGYKFDHWTGDVSDPNSDTAALMMDSTKTVTAHFHKAVQITSGDVNGDGIVDLSDAILALKVLAVISEEDIYTEADVNNDGNIGIEEILFILRSVGTGQ